MFLFAILLISSGTGLLLFFWHKVFNLPPEGDVEMQNLYEQAPYGSWDSFSK